MKHRTHSDRASIPWAEMRVRAGVGAALAAIAAGVPLAIAGVIAWQLEWMLVGAGVAGLGGAARVWLRRRAREAPEMLEEILARAPVPDGACAEELMRLLDRWQAMEDRRGTAEFDPWALQVLRNEIRVVVASDPGLEELFAELRRAA